MTREKISRPSSSVPNQWAALGGCNREGRSTSLGFFGASQGANSAKITKIVTRTTPAVAKRLRLSALAAIHVLAADAMHQHGISEELQTALTLRQLVRRFF